MVPLQAFMYISGWEEGYFYHWVIKHNWILQSNTINIAGEFKLYKSLVTSIFFCGCEKWTQLAD